MSTKTSKKWYESKSKVGTLLLALGPVLATVGGFFVGTIDISSALIQLSTELGAVTAIFGIRDLPFINNK